MKSSTSWGEYYLLKQLRPVTEASEARLKRAEKKVTKQFKKADAEGRAGGPEDRMDANKKMEKYEGKRRQIVSKRASKSRDRLKRIEAQK